MAQVLVIDDDDDTRRILCEVLTDSAAGQVLSLVGILSKESDSLRGEVEAFCAKSRKPNHFRGRARRPMRALESARCQRCRGPTDQPA